MTKLITLISKNIRIVVAVAAAAVVFVFVFVFVSEDCVSVFGEFFKNKFRFFVSSIFCLSTFLLVIYFIFVAVFWVFFLINKT